MSIQLALAKTLANAIKNYHYQTKISKLNVANNKPQFNHTFTMLYRKLLKYRLFDPKEFYIKRVGFFRLHIAKLWHHNNAICQLQCWCWTNIIMMMQDTHLLLPLLVPSLT